MITGIAANAAQASLAAAFGISSIQATHCHLQQIRDGGERAEGHQGDGGSLTCRPFDPVSHEQTEAEPEGSPGEGQKRINR